MFCTINLHQPFYNGSHAIPLQRCNIINKHFRGCKTSGNTGQFIMQCTIGMVLSCGDSLFTWSLNRVLTELRLYKYNTNCQTLVIIYIAEPLFCHSLQCYHCLFIYQMQTFSLTPVVLTLGQTSVLALLTERQSLSQSLSNSNFTLK